MALSSFALILGDQASGTGWRETKDQFSRGDEKISSTRKRNLPPFTAVKAFEAAARHASFKLAAKELCLSPSAVSHQIRAGAVRLIRTRLCQDSDTVPYAAQRLRHSARAAVLFCLKWSRLERLRSWLK
ncbi:LysR family transcriptional regulator [Lutimaribacter saemankumensis]|uniref:LysR family transcriptional regulator n=1 Tax=Lutimaribacter saemankumensis TaxID=490829 RepID=UPI003CCB7D4F